MCYTARAIAWNVIVIVHARTRRSANTHRAGRDFVGTTGVSAFRMTHLTRCTDMKSDICSLTQAAEWGDGGTSKQQAKVRTRTKGSTHAHTG